MPTSISKFLIAITSFGSLAVNGVIGGGDFRSCKVSGDPHFRGWYKSLHHYQGVPDQWTETFGRHMTRGGSTGNSGGAIIRPENYRFGDAMTSGVYRLLDSYVYSADATLTSARSLIQHIHRTRLEHTSLRIRDATQDADTEYIIDVITGESQEKFGRNWRRTIENVTVTTNHLNCGRSCDPTTSETFSYDDITDAMHQNRNAPGKHRKRMVIADGVVEIKVWGQNRRHQKLVVFSRVGTNRENKFVMYRAFFKAKMARDTEKFWGEATGLCGRTDADAKTMRDTAYMVEQPEQQFCPSSDTNAAGLVLGRQYDSVGYYTGVCNYNNIVRKGRNLIRDGYDTVRYGNNFLSCKASSTGQSNIYTKYNVFSSVMSAFANEHNFCESVIGGDAIRSTDSPTESPTQSPTDSPTDNPTESPTQSPTDSPTDSPTESPTQSPTPSPTASPTSPPVCARGDRSCVPGFSGLSVAEEDEMESVVDGEVEENAVGIEQDSLEESEAFHRCSEFVNRLNEAYTDDDSETAKGEEMEEADQNLEMLSCMMDMRVCGDDEGCKSDTFSSAETEQEMLEMNQEDTEKDSTENTLTNVGVLVGGSAGVAALVVAAVAFFVSRRKIQHLKTEHSQALIAASHSVKSSGNVEINV